jgi:predicted ribosome quality control (RQC) complex YloA/Tae2 family protein
MSLNWKEIDLVLSELPLVGCHVQGVVQPAFDTLALYLYRPGRAITLLISLTPNGCRIHETSRAIKKPAKPLRFEEFLKARIKGARIESAEQLFEDPILALVLAKDDEVLTLYARLWSNAGNVILTDTAGTILDCMFRRPKKTEITGGVYNPIQPEKPSKRQFEIRELPGAESFNARIDSWYEGHEGTLSLESLRLDLDRVFNQKESKLSSLLSAMEKKKEEFADGDRYRRLGDVLTANLYRMKRGDAWLEAENFHEGNAVETIRIDPLLSPQENAEAFFEKARKARTGAVELEKEMAEKTLELDKIRAEYERMRRVEDPFVLERFLRKAKTAPQQVEKKYPCLVFKSGPYTFLVGRSASENDDLLRHYVKGFDIWLHARDYPGSYVFIKTVRGKSVPLDVLLDASNLALFYSKGRTSGQGELYYTPVKFLRRAKDGKKGLVLPTQEKNLHVRLDEARLKRLAESAEGL